jgi:FixJ family two-component response regulator
MKDQMISIIEDDLSVREAIETLLKSVGMKYQSFDSAEQFLTGFNPCLEDIIILDLNLPGMNGCDLLKEIKPDGIKIKVIVTTAFDDLVSRELCRQYGVKAFLRKPVDGEALIDLINFNMSSLHFI